MRTNNNNHNNKNNKIVLVCEHFGLILIRFIPGTDLWYCMLKKKIESTLDLEVVYRRSVTRLMCLFPSDNYCKELNPPLLQKKPEFSLSLL